MDSQREGDQPENCTHADPNLPFPAQPAITKGDIPGNPAQQPGQQQSTARELAREFHFVEILSLVINAVLAIVGGIALWIYSGQLSVMQRTLDEMKRSGQGTTEQTNALIGNMNWLARTMDGNLKESRRAAGVSERQSRTALEATVNASRDDQRAWIGFNGYILSNPIAGNPLSAEVSLTNTGKTIGTMTSNIITIVPSFTEINVREFISSKDWQDDQRRRNAAPKSDTALFPNFPFRLPSGPSKGTITTAQEPLIRNGHIFIYIIGEIYYTDIFHRPHISAFCTVHRPSERQDGEAEFRMCSEHNWAN